MDYGFYFAQIAPGCKEGQSLSTGFIPHVSTSMVASDLVFVIKFISFII